MNRTNSRQGHKTKHTHTIRRHTETAIQFSRLEEITAVLKSYGLESANHAGIACHTMSADRRQGLADSLLRFVSPQVFANERLLVLRILADAGCDGISGLLLDEFARNDCEDRWEIGNMLYSTADRRFFPEYAEIARNRIYGTDRQMVVLIFGKLKITEAKPLLINLLGDDTVCGHALDSLSRIADADDIRYFVPFFNCGSSWMRKTAAKFLKKHGADKTDSDS